MTEFVIAALGVYGVAYSLTNLEGPFGVFAWIRGKTAMQSDWFQRGLHCVICVSCWAGLVMALVVNGLAITALIHWAGYLGFSVVVTVILNRLRGQYRNG